MLFLTPRKSTVPVYVPTNITKNLSESDINSLRHSYEQCVVKDTSCVLNHSRGMNEPRQIHALLAALNRPKPSLIVCQRTVLSKWCYELSVNLKVELAADLIENPDYDLDNLDVVLVPHDQLKLVKNVSIDSWFLFVVDEIDLVIKSRFIKNVDTDHRIGITAHNFLVNPESELQWTIMKWANSELVESKDAFIEADKTVRKNLLQPFPDYWQRLSWSLFENTKPTEADALAYDAEVEDWCSKNMTTSVLPPEVKTRSVKRTRGKNEKTVNRRAKTGETKKRRIVSKRKNTKGRGIRNTKQESSDDDVDIKIETITMSPHSDEMDTISCSIKKSPKSYESVNILDIAHSANTSTKTNTIVEKPEGLISDEENPILNSLFVVDKKKTQEKPTKTEMNIQVDYNSDSDTEENSMLDSLLAETISKSVQKNILNAAEVKSTKPCAKKQQDANLILDSLMSSPQPGRNVANNAESADEEDTCAILDLLL